MMAVLMAGATVVPTDPSHPNQRLEAILRNVDAKLILTSETLATRFEHLVATVFLCRSILLIPFLASLICCKMSDLTL